MKLTEKQVFMITKKQKETLSLLHTKYKINTSQFISDAIDEKIQKDKQKILLDYRFMNTTNICPF